LLFAFLPSKSKQTYIRLLELITEKATENGLVFDPHKFNLDFESSAIEALKEKFPNSRMKGCLYHFAQCIWRRVQEQGLSTKYQESKEVRSWIRRGVSLALVPEDRIDDGFLIMQNSVPTSVSQNSATEFHDYMVNTWIDNRRSRFPRLVLCLLQPRYIWKTSR
jgi:hypothetical protein